MGVGDGVYGGGHGGHRELEVVVPIDKVTLGGFQRERESE